jgi:transcription elongation GreA/GreB family factor
MEMKYTLVAESEADLKLENISYLHPLERFTKQIR